jgi:uridylate kinase
MAASGGQGGYFGFVFWESFATLIAMYKRVLLKISGEQLSGKQEFGIDSAVAHYIAKEVKKVIDSGCQLAVVIGGGNLVRGADLAGNGIRRVTADQMGMLSGLMNAMALTDVFENQSLPTRCMSNIYAEQITESYSYRRAEKHFEFGRTIIIAGGLGRPYFTHDTAAVSLALELDCEVVLKATKVDGVYDKDPAKFPDAQRIAKMDYQRAVKDDAIRVMDKAAVGLAMEQHMPVIVLDAMKENNLLLAVQGEPVGTHIG